MGDPDILWRKMMNGRERQEEELTNILTNLITKIPSITKLPIYLLN